MSNSMIENFLEFRKNFVGNPQEQVMKMLQSGNITQDQLNKAQAMAKELQMLLNQMRL